MYALTYVGSLPGDTADRHLDFLMKTFYPDLCKDAYGTNLEIYSGLSDTLLLYVSENGFFEGKGYDHSRLLNLEYPMTDYAVIEHAREHVSVKFLSYATNNYDTCFNISMSYRN